MKTFDDDIKEIEDWENKMVNDLCLKVDKYCKDYQKVRRYALDFIKKLKSVGIEVEGFEIRKEN